MSSQVSWERRMPGSRNPSSPRSSCSGRARSSCSDTRPSAARQSVSSSSYRRKARGTPREPRSVTSATLSHAALLEVSLTRRSASVRRPCPQVMSCDPTTSAGCRSAVRTRRSRPAPTAARCHSGTTQAAWGSLTTIRGSGCPASQSRSSASTAPSSSRAATRCSARGLPSLGRTSAARRSRLWNSITQRGSKWPFALRAEAGTSGGGTCQPSCFRLPASELVPLRIEPVTRTTVWLDSSLVIATAAYGLGVIVSHEHGFVFMKTRKTAGTSVEIALSRVCGPDDVITPVTGEDETLRRASGGRGPQHFESPPLERKAFNHMPVSMVRRMLGRKRFESYFSFAIERNPWDAVVSLYHWKTRDTAPGPGPQPFGEYVASEAVETFATKQQRIYRLDGRVAVDRVLRYESLAEELATVWAELGLPGSPDLPHAKSGTRPPGSSYRSYYDDASRARVAELFAAPIADFGYEF